MARKTAITRDQKSIADELLEMGEEELTPILNGAFHRGPPRSPAEFQEDMLRAFEPLVRARYTTFGMESVNDRRQRKEVDMDAAVTSVYWNEDENLFMNRDPVWHAFVVLTEAGYNAIFPGYL